MDSLTTLKNELKIQKEIIESKSGVVAVKNTNPSPAEISEGIRTIPSFDLSESTAEEEDVAYGKTFYSKNAILKTGTGITSAPIMNALFMCDANTLIYDDEIYYLVPEGTTKIKDYYFSENIHNVTFTFNPDLTVIGQYAFHKASNFTFTNYDQLTNLTSIGSRAFFECSMEGTNFGILPTTLKTIGSYAFGNSICLNMDIKIPKSLTTFNQAAFYSGTRIAVNNLDLSECSVATLPSYAFYALAFNCDFVAPSTIKTIETFFNCSGSFRNITLNDGVILKNQAFGSYTSEPISNFYLETVTFLGETPASIGKTPFAVQNIQNGFKIYVPDNSVEAYKAVANLASFVDCIHPMSEKE